MISRSPDSRGGVGSIGINPLFFYGSFKFQFAISRQGIYSQMEKIHKFQSWIRSAGAGVVEEERKVWEGHPGAVEAREA